MRKIVDSIQKIAEEIEKNIDKSKILIVSDIELFLNYCMRFYDRQFITRNNVNKIYWFDLKTCLLITSNQKKQKFTGYQLDR